MILELPGGSDFEVSMSIYMYMYKYVYIYIYILCVLCCLESLGVATSRCLYVYRCIDVCVSYCL